jgi:hypothetical protein
VVINCLALSGKTTNRNGPKRLAVFNNRLPKQLAVLWLTILWLMVSN